MNRYGSTPPISGSTSRSCGPLTPMWTWFELTSCWCLWARRFGLVSRSLSTGWSCLSCALWWRCNTFAVLRCWGLLLLLLSLTACGYDGPASWLRPEQAVQWAREHGLTDKPVFNEYNFGGYLISQHIPTYVDGRTIVFGDVSYEYYTKRGAVPQETLDKFHVEWLLLHPWAAPYYDTRPGWKRVYTDDVAVIYVREP